MLKTYLSYAFLLCCLLLFTINIEAVEKTCYMITNEPIDVVIPSTHKDLDTLDLCIDHIRMYGIEIRRIIVVSSERLTDNAEWFNEKEFPFTKLDIARQIFQDETTAVTYAQSKRNRLGWIYQQFLKLYAPFVIPGISSNVLILDSDTIFLRPTSFMDENGEALINVGKEYHKPYFVHMAKLLPWLKKLYPNYSGVSHHMLFQKAVLDDLFETVESYHQTEFWRALCDCIDRNEMRGSCLSEYEIYFNFAFARTEQVHIRPLKMMNTESFKNLDSYREEGYDYVSCHSYLRE